MTLCPIGPDDPRSRDEGEREQRREAQQEQEPDQIDMMNEHELRIELRKEVSRGKTVNEKISELPADRQAKIASVVEVTTNQVLRMQLKQALMELSMLKAAPALAIIGFTEPPRSSLSDTIQYRFTWREFSYQTLVNKEVAKSSKYRKYITQFGLEACVRACAEAMMPDLIVTKYTAAEWYAGKGTLQVDGLHPLPSGKC